VVHMVHVAHVVALSLDFLTEPCGCAEESDGVSVNVSFDGSNCSNGTSVITSDTNGSMWWVMSAADVAGRLPLGRSIIHDPSSLFFSYPSPAP
jgi:hypothetical protein